MAHLPLHGICELLGGADRHELDIMVGELCDELRVLAKIGKAGAGITDNPLWETESKIQCDEDTDRMAGFATALGVVSHLDLGEQVDGDGVEG